MGDWMRCWMVHYLCLCLRSYGEGLARGRGSEDERPAGGLGRAGLVLLMEFNEREGWVGVVGGIVVEGLD